MRILLPFLPIKGSKTDQRPKRPTTQKPCSLWGSSRSKWESSAWISRNRCGRRSLEWWKDQMATPTPMLEIWQQRHVMPWNLRTGSCHLAGDRAHPLNSNTIWDDIGTCSRSVAQKTIFHWDGNTIQEPTLDLCGNVQLSTITNVMLQ